MVIIIISLFFIPERNLNAYIRLLDKFVNGLWYYGNLMTVNAYWLLVFKHFRFWLTRRSLTIRMLVLPYYELPDIFVSCWCCFFGLYIFFGLGDWVILFDYYFFETSILYNYTSIMILFIECTLYYELSVFLIRSIASKKTEIIARILKKVSTMSNL